MIAYVTLGTNDLPRATDFYEKLFSSLGAQRLWESETGVAWGVGDGPGVGVLKPFDGKAATRGNGTMVALGMDSKEKVDALYKLAISLGATDEGKPGQRMDGFYAAYFRDLDGNKLNACFFG